jgi:NAD-dependent deacetylase
MNDPGILDLKIRNAAETISSSERIVVFTGAGVSTESGIPDFRSAGGIWSRFEPDDFTIQKFLTSKETRKKQWEILVEGGAFSNIRPNKAHYAVSELEKMGRLDCVITQNIDNLHQKAGNSPDKIFELHGTMKSARCLTCGKQYDIEYIRKKLEKGIEIPECEKCEGILKPDIIFFGESLPPATIDAAIKHSGNCDLLIAIGSSLVVQPAAFIPVYAKQAGAKLIIINISRTPCDEIADIVINGKAGETMAEIVKLLAS